MHDLQPLKRLWWTDPLAVFGGGAVMTMAVAVVSSERSFELYGTNKYLEPWHLLMALAAWGTFSIGVWVAFATGEVHLRRPEDLDTALVPWFWAAYVLTLAGYAAWLLVGLKNGFSTEMLFALLRGTDQSTADDIKTEVFATIPGITTSTQFGMAAMLLGTWLYCRGKSALRLPLISLLIVAAARALLYSERLALIELIVPALMLALRLRLLGRPLAARWRVALQSLPLVAVPLVILLFGSFEYFRSWQYHKENFDSFAEFTVWRFFGYYTTAHNNGAMSMALRGPWPLPYDTFASFWEFPLFESGPLSYEQVAGINPTIIHVATLDRFGNPELNNDGGLFTPARDFGWVGCGLFWLIYGFLAGKAYRGFLCGSLGGSLFYPLFFLALLELPRVQYLTTTRTFPSLMLLAALLLWLSCRQYSTATVPLASSPAQESA